MCDLVARTGRQQQRYEDGYRLVAGCIPFKYDEEEHDAAGNKILKVLMINSQSGPKLLFPKGGWENDETDEEAAVREAMEEAGVKGELKEFLGKYEFRSKSQQDEFSPEGCCKAHMFALHVNEVLESWPEQSTRSRRWLTIPDAALKCADNWFKDALDKFSEYYEHSNTDNKASGRNCEDHSDSRVDDGRR